MSNIHQHAGHKLNLIFTKIAKVKHNIYYHPLFTNEEEESRFLSSNSVFTIICITYICIYIDIYMVCIIMYICTCKIIKINQVINSGIHFYFSVKHHFLEK